MKHPWFRGSHDQLLDPSPVVPDSLELFSLTSRDEVDPDVIKSMTSLGCFKDKTALLQALLSPEYVCGLIRWQPAHSLQCPVPIAACYAVVVGWLSNNALFAAAKTRRRWSTACCCLARSASRASRMRPGRWPDQSPSTLLASASTPKQPRPLSWPCKEQGEL